MPSPWCLSIERQGIYREWQFAKHSDEVWAQFFALTGMKPLVWFYEDYSFDRIVDLATEWGVKADTSTPRNLVKLPAGRRAAMCDEFARRLLASEFPSTRGHTAEETARALHDAVPPADILPDKKDEPGMGVMAGQVPWQDLPASTGATLRDDFTKRAAALLDSISLRWRK